MLEKSDLQQIRTVIREEIEGRTPVIVKGVVKNIVDPQFSSIKKDIKTIKTDVAKIRRDIRIVIDTFDHEYLDLRSRVEKIEEKIGIAV